ncbi:MAG: hypothetical protein IPL92_17875 [Saprospiraceae bacterium]|nr:hypothetical protein [Candidatus Opimibacter iunctus]
MKTNDFLSILDNPNLISGIYNYCDRWCERCSMTARCSVFQTTPQLNPDDFANEEDFFKEVFKGVSESFQLTMELLQESADERGIDLTPSEEDDEWIEKRNRQKEETQNTSISLLAMEYLDLGKKWLDNSNDALKTLQEDLQSSALMDLPERNPEQEALALKDALEVIPYYLHQIYVKLLRAQEGREEDDAWFEENDFPKDSDGSAKVALIGIDNSIRAWEVMLQYLPIHEGDILTILSLLENLRRQVETTFPDARAFKRPGFDD